MGKFESIVAGKVNSLKVRIAHVLLVGVNVPILAEVAHLATLFSPLVTDVIVSVPVEARYDKNHCA